VKKEQKRSLEETLSTGDMQRMKSIPGVRLSSFAHSPLFQTRLLLLPSSSKQICFVPGQRSSQLYHVRKFTAACYHQETRSEWKRTWSHLLLRPLASLPRAETSRAETKELSESRETKEGLASSLAYDATKEKDDRSQQPPETTATAEEEEEAGLACTDDDATKPDKPEMCTADELHYVSVPGTDWRLALWRYLPASDVSVPQALNFCSGCHESSLQERDTVQMQELLQFQMCPNLVAEDLFKDVYYEGQSSLETGQ
jgi:hypothetical protein